MPRTPGEIRAHSLPRRPFGVSAREAGRALEELAAAHSETTAEAAGLRAEVARLTSELARYEELERVLRDTLVTAERSAEELRSSARREADTTIDAARLKAREIVFEAERERERVETEVKRLRAIESDVRGSYRAFLIAALERLEQSEASEAPTEIRHPVG